MLQQRIRKPRKLQELKVEVQTQLLKAQILPLSREVDGIHGCSIQPWEVWCLALAGQEGEKEPMA